MTEPTIPPEVEAKLMEDALRELADIMAAAAPDRFEAMKLHLRDAVLTVYRLGQQHAPDAQREIITGIGIEDRLPQEGEVVWVDGLGAGREIAWLEKPMEQPLEWQTPHLGVFPLDHVERWWPLAPPDPNAQSIRNAALEEAAVDIEEGDYEERAESTTPEDFAHDIAAHIRALKTEEPTP